MVLEFNPCTGNGGGVLVRSVDVQKGKKKGKLLNGMCRLRVAKGGFLLKLLHAIKEEVIRKV